MSFWIFILLIVTVVTCGEVLSKWAEASGRQPKLPRGERHGAEGELTELRDTVARLSERLERVSEEQRFLTRLLEERPTLPDTDERME